MVCCQAPVIVLFVPFVAEVAQDTAVGLPIDGFLLDVGVGIALLVPFQHLFLGDATGVIVNVIVL